MTNAITSNRGTSKPAQSLCFACRLCSSIAFTPEGGYTMSEIYQDSEGSSFTGKGTWTVREDGKSVLLDSEDKDERDRAFEVVSPTELRMLDQAGKPIDSTLDYSLRRR